MSVVISKAIKINGKNELLNAERFESSSEVMDLSNCRNITSNAFHNKHTEHMDVSWEGVRTWSEVENYMNTGYSPAVEKLSNTKANLEGQAKRVRFGNEVVGFMPIVPLVLQGVPNCMINTRMKPIKAKVVNIYFDMTCKSETQPEEIMRVGQNVLAAITELEMQGYRFNLYSTQTYYDYGEGADILCVKIKNANTPLNIKRMSFALTHPAFFRAVGFDWYSRFPKGKYRISYGIAMAYAVSDDELAKIYEELFNEKCVVFTCVNAMKKDKEYFKSKLEGGKAYA